MGKYNQLYSSEGEKPRKKQKTEKFKDKISILIFF